MRVSRPGAHAGLWIIAAALFTTTATCQDRGVGSDPPEICECGPCADSDEECLRCGDGLCDRGETPASCSQDCHPVAEVDLLLVIDNAEGDGNAAPFYEQFPALVQGLRLSPDGMPSLHVGVITTDVSIGPNELPTCDAPDDGRLVGGDTLAPYLYGGSYLVDARPTGCAVQRSADGTCLGHDCGPEHCVEQHTTLQEEPDTGCPRCRNYHDTTLAEAIMFSTWVGTMGCGFEQPLEAMRLALDDHPDNQGFLRQDSLLAVWFYTGEDDCSAADTRLFSEPEADLASELGPLSSFRCFEWSTTCDVNDRTVVGPRTGCVERADGNGLLHPISRYVDFLCGLREPGQVLVSGTLGTITPSPNGVGVDVEVAWHALGNPRLAPSCYNAMTEAIPPVRLHQLISAFNSEADMATGLTDYCALSKAPAFLSLGHRMAQHTTDATLPAP